MSTKPVLDSEIVEIQTEYELQKERSRREKEDYLNRVPQLKQVMNDFMTACLSTKPQDVRAFAAHYFSRYIPPVSRSSETKEGSVTSPKANSKSNKEEAVDC